MARIPETELERLKRDVSLERLAEARGVKLKRHGADLIGLCPFHEDHDPSLVISPAKNLWHCLGACQAGGSVVDWVMKAHGVSFRHAVELLREDLPPLDSPSPVKRGRQQGPVAKHSTVTKLPKLLERDTEDDAVLRQVVDFYHQTLLENPAALDYLDKRGLRSSEMVERFCLGFADRTLGYEMTTTGRVLSAITNRMTFPLVRPLWAAASAAFARGAQGAVDVFQAGSVRLQSVWATVEFPILQSQGNPINYTVVP